MTRAELARWLQVPEDKPIHPGIVADMEKVPYPTDDEGELNAFSSFLKTCDKHGIRP